MSRKELKQVDPLTKRLDEYMQWVVKNKVKLIIAGVALTALILLLAIKERRDAAQTRAHAATVSTGLSALSNPVIAVPEGEAQPANTYKEAKDRNAAAIPAIDALIKEMPDSDVAAVATVIRAGLDGEGTNVGASLDRLEGEKALKPWIQLARSSSAGAGQDPSATLQSVATGNADGPVVARILAYMQMGDRHHPLMTANGDAKKAAAAYTTARSLIDSSPGVGNGLIADLRGSLQARVSLLGTIKGDDKAQQ